MGKVGLLGLRVTMGGLMLFWGLDKLFNVEHSVRVSESFYLGVGANVLFMNAFGVAQSLLGLVVIIGYMRRYAYPAMFAITLVTALGVWRSIVDPWGWVLEGSNVLFYPSAIILSAALTLWGLIDEDTTALDARGVTNR